MREFGSGTCEEGSEDSRSSWVSPGRSADEPRPDAAWQCPGGCWNSRWRSHRPEVILGAVKDPQLKLRHPPPCTHASTMAEVDKRRQATCCSEQNNTNRAEQQPTLCATRADIRRAVLTTRRPTPMCRACPIRRGPTAPRAGQHRGCGAYVRETNQQDLPRAAGPWARRSAAIRGPRPGDRRALRRVPRPHHPLRQGRPDSRSHGWRRERASRTSYGDQARTSESFSGGKHLLERRPSPKTDKDHVTSVY